MKILHVSCSPKGQNSESHRLAGKIVAHLLERQPGAICVNRDVGGGDLTHIDGNYAHVLSSKHPPSGPVSDEGSIVRSDVLIRELESADVLVIGTPMHNLTVPSALKAWIDHVVRIHRTFKITVQGKVGIADRPVLIGVSSGGIFSGESATQPDFLTPYLRAVLGSIGLHDVTFFSVEGTAFGPEAVAQARTETDRALSKFFATFQP